MASAFADARQGNKIPGWVWPWRGDGLPSHRQRFQPNPVHLLAKVHFMWWTLVQRGKFWSSGKRSSELSAGSSVRALTKMRVRSLVHVIVCNFWCSATTGKEEEHMNYLHKSRSGTCCWKAAAPAEPNLTELIDDLKGRHGTVGRGGRLKKKKKKVYSRLWCASSFVRDGNYRNVC